MMSSRGRHGWVQDRCYAGLESTKGSHTGGPTGFSDTLAPGAAALALGLGRGLACAAQAANHNAQVVDELWRLVDLEVKADHGDPGREVVQGVRAGSQDASLRIDDFDRADCGCDLLGDGLSGAVDGDAGLVAVDTGGDVVGGVADDIGVGRLAGLIARTGRCSWLQPVHAKGSPACPVDVPGDQVPAATSVHQAVGLHAPPAGGAIVAAVVEA